MKLLLILPIFLTCVLAHSDVLTYSDDEQSAHRQIGNAYSRAINDNIADIPKARGFYQMSCYQDQYWYGDQASYTFNLVTTVEQQPNDGPVKGNQVVRLFLTTTSAYSEEEAHQGLKICRDANPDCGAAPFYRATTAAIDKLNNITGAKYSKTFISFAIAQDYVYTKIRRVDNNEADVDLYCYGKKQ